jgi:hypothetical protein
MRKILPIILTLTLFLSTVFPIYSEDLESGNFKIVGATTNSAGQVLQGTDNSLLTSVGDFSGDPRIYSTTYRINPGPLGIFSASVPKVACFETDTNGSSNCTTGPSYLNTNGMITVCGPTGCYNNARFEINAQTNPSDTLYGIQISDDDFSTDIRYIDGQTFKPKTRDLIDINDYKTKSVWESEVRNIKGLEQDTQYWIRITALHGDFTESEPSQTATATTALSTVTFDIDIEDETGTAAETGAPYSISFTTERRLVVSGPPQTAENLIWLDTETNGLGGFAILQSGLNGGLFSSTESYTVTSATVDLNSTTEGFGLQSFYTAETYGLGSGNGSLGVIDVSTGYDGTGNYVGEIQTTLSKIYETDAPTLQGRVGIKLKARASTSTPPATDYSEEITLILVPRY